MENTNIGRIMGVGIPDNEDVINVEMGTCIILDDENKTHLITYGLGPCVGVAIVIKTEEGKIMRLLAHLDMGQTIGLNFQSFKSYLSRLKQKCVSKVENIEIQLVSSVSFIRLFTQKRLTSNEKQLLQIIINEFKEYNIRFEDLMINRNSSVSQVQISPSGKITCISDDMRRQYDYFFETRIIPNFDVNEMDGLYVTKYGAYMGNSSLQLNCNEQEKTQALSSNYWQEYIKRGYKLNIAPSFNNENCMAVYLENWQEIKGDYGIVPGCIQNDFERHKLL